MIAFVFALLIGLMSASASPAQAERAYRTGRFDEAYEIYQQALSEPDLAKGPLLYNLGNCAYRLGRHTEALHYYRRAQLRMPRDQQLEFNLRLTERALGIDPRAEMSFIAVLLAWLDQFAPALLLALAGGLQAIGLAGLLLLRAQRTTRRALALAVLLGLVLSVRLLQVQFLASPPDAIALASKIELRPEPHLDLPVTLEVNAGETLRVEDLSDRWARVVHSSGSGWTERRGIGLIH